MITKQIATSYFPSKPLSEVADFLDHLRKPVKQSDRKAGPYPYYGANGLQGTIDGFLFDEPLILLAEDGGHFDEPERGIAYTIKGKTWVNNHAHIVKPKGDTDFRFLYHVLRNYDVNPFISGSTRKKLTKGQASLIEIPLPPLPEQKRIAAILDQADALRRQRQRAIEHLNQLGQSIFYEMFGATINVHEENDSSVTIDDVCTIKGGGTPSKANAEYYTGDIPWVSPKDMKFWEIETAKDKITPEAVKQSATNLIPPASVLVVNRSGILKHTVPIGITQNSVAINQDIKALIPNSKITTTFLANLLKFFEPKILTWVRATTADNFQLDQLKQLSFNLPSIARQKTFDELYFKVRRLSSEAENNLKTSENLFASLQQRAFRGEL